jgi:hypothetical protein
VLDTADGSCQVRDLYGDREWTNGTQFLRQNSSYVPNYEGSRPISFSPCDDGWVVVEPAFLYQTGTWDGLAHPWSVEIQLVVRSGCS